MINADRQDNAAPPSINTRPRIVLLGTGGTIASSASRTTQLVDYKVTSTAESVLATVPEVRELAEVRCEQIVNVDSHEIDNALLLTIARRAQTVLQEPEVDAVVITHGTDTLEETAYFLNLTLKSAKPVVLVGAMRPASSLSADGPLNLYNAVRLATCPAASGKGVLVTLNDRIVAARSVTKSSTSFTDAFGSGEEGHLGQIAGGVVYFFNAPLRDHTLETEFSLNDISELPQVDILYDHQAAGTHLYRAAIDAGAKGLVLAGWAMAACLQQREQAQNWQVDMAWCSCDRRVCRTGLSLHCRLTSRFESSLRTRSILRRRACC